jgi:hypothetical protein
MGCVEKGRKNYFSRILQDYNYNSSLQKISVDSRQNLDKVVGLHGGQFGNSILTVTNRNTAIMPTSEVTENNS